MTDPRPQGWPQPPPGRPSAARHRRFPRWRPLTWVILAFNLLMLLWLSVGINAASDDESCRTGDQLCEDANDLGTALGAGFVLFVWAAGAVILGVIWLVTNRPSERRPQRPRPPQPW